MPLADVMQSVASLTVALLVLLALPAAAHGQRSATTQPVTGVAIDTTGAVLPNADLVLTATGGGVQQTTTDAAGNFRFDAVPPGRYDVRVAFEGFQPTVARVTVGGRAPSPLKITLQLTSLKQEVTVRNHNSRHGSSSEAVVVVRLQRSAWQLTCGGAKRG